MPILIPLATTAYGIYSSSHAASQRKQAENNLENQANNMKPNASILDYYQKSLAKYSANPYESQSYQQQNNQIQRNLATGINSTQNKRLGLAGIAGQVQQANDAQAKAASNAQAQSGADLARLGNAAGMKTAEEQKKTDLLFNLQAQKAGAYASTENSGIRNIFNGLSTAASMYGGYEDNRSSAFGGLGYGGSQSDRISKLNKIYGSFG